MPKKEDLIEEHRFLGTVFSLFLAGPALEGKVFDAHLPRRFAWGELVLNNSKLGVIRIEIYDLKKTSQELLIKVNSVNEKTFRDKEELKEFTLAREDLMKGRIEDVIEKKCPGLLNHEIGRHVKGLSSRAPLDNAPKFSR